MKEKLIDDINEKDDKTGKQTSINKVRKAIGFYEPEYECFKMCDEKGKSWAGAEIKKRLVWEVTKGDGSFYTAGNQFEAEVISYLAQINERLKRVEKKIK